MELLVLLLFWFLGSVVVGYVASERGRWGIIWLILALLISPVLAYAAVVGAPPKPPKQPGP